MQREQVLQRQLHLLLQMLMILHLQLHREKQERIKQRTVELDKRFIQLLRVTMMVVVLIALL